MAAGGHVEGLGEVVSPPRLLAGGRGEGVWQLRPAPQQRVRAVNLPRSSQLSNVQVEIIPVTTLYKLTLYRSLLKTAYLRTCLTAFLS